MFHINELCVSADIQEECVGLQDLLVQLNAKLSSGFICITVDACRDDPSNATFAGSGYRGEAASRSSKVKKRVHLHACYFYSALVYSIPKAPEVRERRQPVLALAPA